MSRVFYYLAFFGPYTNDLTEGGSEMVKLREIRKSKGLRQYALSNLTGIAQSRISILENNYAIPTENERIRLAQALRVQREELFPSIKNSGMP